MHVYITCTSKGIAAEAAPTRNGVPAGGLEVPTGFAFPVARIAAVAAPTVHYWKSRSCRGRGFSPDARRSSRRMGGASVTKLPWEGLQSRCSAQFKAHGRDFSPDARRSSRRMGGLQSRCLCAPEGSAAEAASTAFHAGGLPGPCVCLCSGQGMRRRSMNVARAKVTFRACAGVQPLARYGVRPHPAGVIRWRSNSWQRHHADRIRTPEGKHRCREACSSPSP